MKASILSSLGLVAAVAGLAASPAAAQSGGAPAAPAPAAAPALTGVRADVADDMSFIEKRLVDLAEAVPAEKFGWRPAEGVRSVAEVYLHVALANFNIPSFVGVEAPAGMSDWGLEKKITAKAEVIDFLKKSFAHAKAAVGKVADADLDKKVKLFGREMTTRNVLLLINRHQHEHLGQSIAYARSNGVTPPWSKKGDS